VSSNKTNSSASIIPVRELATDFDPAGVAELDLYQKREKIYTRKVEGFYQRIRLYTGWPLLLGYFLLPWLNWNGGQAVLFDLPKRQFTVFDITFWPQDFPLLALVMIIAAFALFATTAWVGRLWCGYSCPQTVWTAVFMWAEQWCEGSRNQRIKRDKGPWSREKLARKAAKHGIWLGFALLTGMTFVGYFSPIRALTVNFFTVSLAESGGLIWGLSWGEIAWINFFACATYINAGWLREQVCMYMCPYARFQSVMFDKDTLLVCYDHARGEKRGARKRDAEATRDGMGDCVDCQICVQVCPTGIDIRDGLQYQCINCALCIDGCNSVMDQMGYARGLIRYSTEHELEGKKTQFLRPRLIGYGLAVLLMLVFLLAALVSRIPLGLDVIRDRDRLYMETSGGFIENSYTLKILNMDQTPHRYSVSFLGLEAATLVGQQQIVIDGGEVAQLAIRLRIDAQALQQPNTSIIFSVVSQQEPALTTSAESRFIGPSR